VQANRSSARGCLLEKRLAQLTKLSAAAVTLTALGALNEIVAGKPSLPYAALHGDY
jgi:hypothetical protein